MRPLVASALCVVLTGAAAPAAPAEAAPAVAVPARHQAVLMLRVLLYDRTLPLRSTQTRLEVLVVAPAREGRGPGADPVAAALEQLATNAVVGGRKIIVRTVTPDALAAALEREAAAAVYLAPGVEPAPALKLVEQAKTLSFSADRTAIDAGAAIGFVPDGARIKLSVNLKRVKASGADLDAELLALAEVKG